LFRGDLIPAYVLCGLLTKSQAKEKETAKDLSAQIALSSSLQKTVAELENLKAALEAKVKALEDENAELAGQVGKASSEAAALRAEVGRLRAGNDPEQPRARGAKFLDQKLEEAKMQLKMRTHKVGHNQLAKRKPSELRFFLFVGARVQHHLGCKD
jgi:predicted RNase H-like nuclease (RuvC/YqgF family)